MGEYEVDGASYQPREGKAAEAPNLKCDIASRRVVDRTLWLQLPSAPAMLGIPALRIAVDGGGSRSRRHGRRGQE